MELSVRRLPDAGKVWNLSDLFSPEDCQPGEVLVRRGMVLDKSSPKGESDCIFAYCSDDSCARVVVYRDGGWHVKSSLQESLSSGCKSTGATDRAIAMTIADIHEADGRAVRGLGDSPKWLKALWSDLTVRAHVAGYEIVEYAEPGPGDIYMLPTGEINSGATHRGQALILRTKWKPPEWMKRGWLAMDDVDGWFWQDREPVVSEDIGQDWDGPGDCDVRIEAESLMAILGQFDLPPTPADWRTSKINIADCVK